MLVRWILLASVIAAPQVLVAQLPPVPGEPAPGDKKRPGLFVEEQSLDLGEVLEGEKRTIAWIIENRGTADLVIDSAKSGCGCTVVKLTEADKIIHPGGRLELEAVFDSTGRRGNQNKTVEVRSNDPVYPVLKLTFTARIDALYDMTPKMLSLQSLQRGSKARQGIKIALAEGHQKLEILGVELADSLRLTPAIEDFESKGVTGKLITFTVNDDAPLGNINTSVQIRLRVDGHERRPSLRVRGRIVGELMTTPMVLDATRGRLLRGHRLAPVSLRSANKTVFAIRSATAGTWFDVQIEPGKRKPIGSAYTLRVVVREDAPAGPFGVNLEIHTDVLDQPVVYVPIFGVIAPTVMVHPPVALLRQDGTAVGTSRRIKLQAAPHHKLTVHSILCDNDAIIAELEPLLRDELTSHIRYVLIKLDKKLPPGTFDAIVTLETSEPGALRIEIPVRIAVPGT